MGVYQDDPKSLAGALLLPSCVLIGASNKLSQILKIFPARRRLGEGCLGIINIQFVLQVQKKCGTAFALIIGIIAILAGVVADWRAIN